MVPAFGPSEGLSNACATEQKDNEEQEEFESVEQIEDEKSEESFEIVENVENVENVTEDIETLTLEETDDRSPEQKMDDVVEQAFLQALRTTAKKIELPVLTSNFFRLYMVPASNDQIDLKKSSYKKLSKFLAKMNADKICVIKEQKKGVEVISSIDYEHEKVTSFRTIKIEPKDDDSNETPAKFKPPIVTELNIVTAQVASFFKECKVAKGAGITSVDVRECVKVYVKQEGLQNAEDPSVVNLDPLLAEVVLIKGENAITSFRWDKITSRITSKMTKGYSMDFQDGKPPQVLKGKLEPIEFLLGSRSGNKKVTLIHNLDVYGIDMQDFAHKCQVGVAASTTIHEAVNKKRAGGHPVMEVLVQGNQIAFANDLLLNDYKIPRKFIRGAELAAKGKKGKK